MNNEKNMIKNTTYLYAGTDELGRTVDAVIGSDDTKEVGVFYFLWLGSHGAEHAYDVTKIIEKNPNAAESAETWMAAGGGDLGEAHWWGESLFGYHTQEDEWVIDKDIQMLTDAGVDFLGVDCTNGFAYTEKWMVLLKVLDKYYNQGFKVPRVTPIVKAHPGRTIMTVYQDIYMAHPEYQNLWYCMNGKPVMIGDKDAEGLSEECLEFYTFIFPQWPREPYRADGLPWMDFGLWTDDKSLAIFGTEDTKTAMCVSLAQHSGTKAFSTSAFYGDTTNRTRSWHDGANDPAEDAYLYGYNFAEQFDYVYKCNPDIIFITGWNEWFAQRQRKWLTMEGEPHTDPIILVDNADVNNSRDIQPMKGGYGDNYYMQMVQYIRKFKGATVPNEKLNTEVEVRSITIDVKEDFSQWDDVEWYYQDYVDDTNPRDAIGYGGIHYTDNSGRNDIATIKVANDKENLYAYVQTVDDIIGMGEEHCLSMFISTGNNESPTWYGYDYVVSRVPASVDKLVVEKHTENGWTKIDEVAYLMEENKLQFEIPLATLGLQSDNISIQFKVADNYQDEEGIYSFYLHGDAAPYGRLNYVYISNGVDDIPKHIINETKAIPNGR